MKKVIRKLVNFTIGTDGCKKMTVNRKMQKKMERFENICRLLDQKVGKDIIKNSVENISTSSEFFETKKHKETDN